MSVRFHLPNFVDRFNGSMNMTLISMIKRMPRMFYDGVEIASVFDCFPMIWNGGRIMAGYMDMQTVDKLVPPVSRQIQFSGSALPPDAYKSSPYP